MFCSVFRLAQLIKYFKKMRVCVCVRVCVCLCRDFPGSSVGKESACNTEDIGSVPGLGRSHGEGHSNPLQYSCLENCMNRGAWQAIANGVAESRTQLKGLSMYARIIFQTLLSLAIQNCSLEAQTASLKHLLHHSSDMNLRPAK